jgi:hypothetical protein
MLGRYAACISGSLSLFVLIVAGVYPSQAQSASVPLSQNLNAERSLLTERFATEKLWMWQKRLNLQEWDIAVVVSRASDLKPRTLGNIHWDREKKTATIRVLDPADYSLPFEAMLQDVEFTLVHELIHLEIVPILSDLQRTDANRMEEEHAVNHMAEALLKLDRGRL